MLAKFCKNDASITHLQSVPALRALAQHFPKSKLTAKLRAYATRRGLNMCAMISRTLITANLVSTPFHSFFDVHNYKFYSRITLFAGVES